MQLAWSSGTRLGPGHRNTMKRRTKMSHTNVTHDSAAILYLDPSVSLKRIFVFSVGGLFSLSTHALTCLSELYFVVKARFSVDCIPLHKVEVIMQASSSPVPLFCNLYRESVLLLKSCAGLWHHFLLWNS